MLCRIKSDGSITSLYAMKTLRKADLIERDQVEHADSERRILQNTRNLFLVNLQHAFQTEHMVLDYVPGGLFFWLVCYPLMFLVPSFY